VFYRQLTVNVFDNVLSHSLGVITFTHLILPAHSYLIITGNQYSLLELNMYGQHAPVLLLFV